MHVLSIPGLYLTEVDDFELSEVFFREGQRGKNGDEGYEIGKKGNECSKLSFLFVPQSFLPTRPNCLDVSYMP